MIDVLAGTWTATRRRSAPSRWRCCCRCRRRGRRRPKGSLCTEDCYFDSDGYCDDGGEGAQYRCATARLHRCAAPRPPAPPTAVFPPIFPPARPTRPRGARLRPAMTNTCDAVLDIVLVLDRSASVLHHHEAIKEFAQELISQFALSDTKAQVGVVDFNHDATTHLGLSADKNAIVAAIDGMAEPDGATSISDGLDAGIQVLFDDPMRDHQSPECDSYGPGTNHHDCASFDKQRFGTSASRPTVPSPASASPRAEADRAVRLRVRSRGLLQDSRQPAPGPRLLRPRRLGDRGATSIRHGARRRRRRRLPERGADRLAAGCQRPDRPRHVPRPLYGARRGDVVREALRCRPGVHGLRRRRRHGLQRRPLRRVPHVHDRDPRQRRGVRARRRWPPRVGAAECYIKKDTVCACTSVNPWCSPETGWCYQSEAVAITALPISAYNPFTQDPNCSCNQHFEADAGDLSAYDLCPRLVRLLRPRRQRVVQRGGNRGRRARASAR